MHQKLMDDLTRSYYKMYDCDVVVEEFPAAQKVKYHVIPEGVDVEAIKRKITEKGQKAADPKRTRKDVEELHNQRRREVKKLVGEEKAPAPKPTRLPRSREKYIGGDDWSDPHPETRDWGDDPPQINRLKKRMRNVIETQRRQDKEVGYRKEEFEYILSYLLDNGFAADEESAENIMEAMSEKWIQSILDETIQ